MAHKRYRSQYDFLFVGKDEGSFVENYAYDLGENGEDSGKIFISLEITQNSVDPDKIGDLIFDSLRKVFFRDGEIDGYERFESALKEVNKNLNDFKSERDNDWLGKLNIIIAAIVGDQLYLTQSGEAEAYLLRKKFLTTISDDLSEQSSTDIFTNIASGDLEDGDLVLLSTTRLLRYVSKNDLAKQVGGNLHHSVQNIRDFLQGEVLNKIALIAIQGNLVDQSNVIRDNEVEEDGKQISSTVKNKTKEVNIIENVKNFFVDLYYDLKDRIGDLTSDNEEVISRSSRSKIGSSWSFSNWSKDKFLIAIIVLICILTLGIWWLRTKADENVKIQNYANNLIAAREEVNSAITTSQFDKAKASELLSDAHSKAIEVLNSGYSKDKARELLDLIVETQDKLDGVIHPEAQLMADLSTKRDNVSALGLVKFKDKLYAYEYNALYPIALDHISDPLTIDDNEKVVSAVNFDDKGSILFLTENGRLLEYKDDRISFLQTSDEVYKKGRVIKSYSNKIYILDPNSNQIWRYTRRRDSFDGAQPYANDVNLENGVDIAIDGNIYVLGSDGYITKLFQGNKQDFPIKKEPTKPLDNPVKLFTEAEMSQIYILDKTENKILVYNKDDRSGGATYSGQYVFDDLSDIRDFYVDKNTNTLYVLTPSKVYRVVLNP